MNKVGKKYIFIYVFFKKQNKKKNNLNGEICVPNSLQSSYFKIQ